LHLLPQRRESDPRTRLSWLHGGKLKVINGSFKRCNGDFAVPDGRNNVLNMGAVTAKSLLVMVVGSCSLFGEVTDLEKRLEYMPPP